MTCIVILPQLRILSPVMPVGTKSQLWPKFFLEAPLTVLSWNPQKSGTRTGIFSLNILMASVSPVIYNLQPFCKDICTSLYLIRFTICIFVFFALWLCAQGHFGVWWHHYVGRVAICIMSTLSLTFPQQKIDIFRTEIYTIFRAGWPQRSEWWASQPEFDLSLFFKIAT